MEEGNVKLDRAKIARSSRKRGHDLERRIASEFRKVGFTFAKTSRYASTMLDASKVDIAFVPYLVQCKKGYKKGLNYTNILLEMKEALKKNFPPDDKVHEYPSIIIHDKDRKPEEKLVIMEESTFWGLINKNKNKDKDE